MAVKRVKYVIARSFRKRVTTGHIMSDTTPNMTRCGRDIREWPWRSYPRDLPEIILCMKCNPSKLDWEGLRNG